MQRKKSNELSLIDFNIESLPHEILLMIASNLRFPDISSLAQTNKDMQIVIEGAHTAYAMIDIKINGESIKRPATYSEISAILKEKNEIRRKIKLTKVDMFYIVMRSIGDKALKSFRLCARDKRTPDDIEFDEIHNRNYEVSFFSVFFIVGILMVLYAIFVDSPDYYCNRNRDYIFGCNPDSARKSHYYIGTACSLFFGGLFLHRCVKARVAKREDEINTLKSELSYKPSLQLK